MKKLILVGVLLFSVVIFAQNIEPKHEVVDGLVKSTYFYENGKVSQTGFYKDGKVHGQWTSFDQNGSKISIGTFAEGKKVGKWFFWNSDSLNEVDYSNNKIAAVKNWKENAVAARN